MSTTDPRTPLGTLGNQLESIGMKNGESESQTGAQLAHTGTSGWLDWNFRWGPDVLVGCTGSSGRSHQNFWWLSPDVPVGTRQPTNSRSTIPKSNQTNSKCDETWGVSSQDLHGPIPTRSPQKDPGSMRNRRFPKKGQVFLKNTKTLIQSNSRDLDVQHQSSCNPRRFGKLKLPASQPETP